MNEETIESVKLERDRYLNVIKLIVGDYIELSHDKVMWQRNDWLKKCHDVLYVTENEWFWTIPSEITFFTVPLKAKKVLIKLPEPVVTTYRVVRHRYQWIGEDGRKDFNVKHWFWEYDHAVSFIKTRQEFLKIKKERFKNEVNRCGV